MGKYSTFYCPEGLKVFSYLFPVTPLRPEGQGDGPLFITLNVPSVSSTTAVTSSTRAIPSEQMAACTSDSVTLSRRMAMGRNRPWCNSSEVTTTRSNAFIFARVRLPETRRNAMQHAAS
jgi:hypothetical protein